MNRYSGGYYNDSYYEPDEDETEDEYNDRMDDEDEAVDEDEWERDDD